MTERGIVGRCLLIFAHACRCSPCFAGYAAAINQNQSVNDVIEVNQSRVHGNEAVPPKRESYRDQRSFELALRKWNNDQAALSVMATEGQRNLHGSGNASNRAGSTQPEPSAPPAADESGCWVGICMNRCCRSI